MGSVHRLRIGLGAALVAAFVWVVAVGVPAIEESDFRSQLRTSGLRFDARVTEAGFERPDGTLREVVVTGPFGNLVGVDLGESLVRVHEVGDELRVVVPGTAYHRGLPEDVVDRSVAPYLAARLAPPGVVAVSLLIALVIAHRRVRSSGQHH